MNSSGESGTFLYEVVVAILRGLVKGVFLGLVFSTTSIYLSHRRRDRCDRF
jgi:hypothetical protein